MPPVRTETFTFDAFGARFACESAGGCSTIVPLDVPTSFATVYSIGTGSVGMRTAVR